MTTTTDTSIKKKRKLIIFDTIKFIQHFNAETFFFSFQNDVSTVFQSDVNHSHSIKHFCFFDKFSNNQRFKTNLMTNKKFDFCIFFRFEIYYSETKFQTKYVFNF